jgi:hypothetical protein
MAKLYKTRPTVAGTENRIRFLLFLLNAQTERGSLETVQPAMRHFGVGILTEININILFNYESRLHG